MARSFQATRFLHGGWWQVLPNMAGLWVFGAIAEPVMGTRSFVFTASRQFVKAFEGDKFLRGVTTRWGVILQIFTVTAGASEPH